MTDISDNFSSQSIAIEPSVLIEEVSSEEFLIGTSKSFNNPSHSNWKIKRIWKVGNVWKHGYPDGNQGFVFSWDLRYGYIYS